MAVEGVDTSTSLRIAQLDDRAVALLSGGRPDLAVGSELESLVAADLTNHPWAQLVVAAALNDWRDDRAEPMLEAAVTSFRQHDDSKGQGYAACVRGNIALARGHLTEAARWYERCREYLQNECPVDAVALAHTGLAAYQEGDLRQAIAITEESLAIARIQGSRRFEGLACLYLAFFAIITGTFGRADTLLAVAEEAYLELPDPMERFELPLILAGQGVVAALRGYFLLADDRLASAIAMAADIQVPWYAAISLVLRAEFTASHNPRRSLADARNGLEQLKALGDEWWQTWAIRAQGTAAREVGDLGASQEILERLLGQELNPMERGLTLLALGESILRTDHPRDAIAHLEDARSLLDGIGANYWVARCWIALADANPSKRRDRRQRARALAEDDGAYQRLLAEEPSELRITVFGEAGVWLGEKRLTFPTRNAELAVFCLALAGPAGLHEDVLIERLWPGAPADRGRGRLRTALWQVRRGLGREGWRVVREQHSVRLELRGIAVDILDARIHAVMALAESQDDQRALTEVVTKLSAPLLPDWQYEPWVEVESERNATLLRELRTVQRGPRPAL